MFSDDDRRHMARALELAQRGLYTTTPNPRVGCVIVRGGAVVGEGWHEKAGGPHAEVVALKAAGPQAAGATVYVTLEPCAMCAGTQYWAHIGQLVYVCVGPDRLEVFDRGVHAIGEHARKKAVDKCIQFSSRHPYISPG